MEIMREVVAGAAFRGHRIAETFVQEMLNYTEPHGSLPDKHENRFRIKKAILEVEAIFGNPMRAIKNMHGSAPRMEMLYQELKYLDDKAKPAVFERIKLFA